MTKLKGTLPAGDNSNGLDALNLSICANPLKQFLVIAVVEGDKITTDVSSGAQEAQLRIRRIEAVLPDQANWVSDAMTAAFEKRTGSNSLPIEVDPETGEVIVKEPAAAEPEPERPSTQVISFTKADLGALNDLDDALDATAAHDCPNPRCGTWDDDEDMCCTLARGHDDEHFSEHAEAYFTTTTEGGEQE